MAFPMVWPRWAVAGQYQGAPPTPSRMGKNFTLAADFCCNGLPLGLLYNGGEATPKKPKSTEFKMAKRNFSLPAELTFSIAGGQVTVETKDLPDESIIAVLNYGATRFINDKVGGKDKTAEEKAALADAWITRLKEGDLSPARGPRKDPMQIEMDRIVAEHLVKAGWKKTDAVKEGKGAHGIELFTVEILKAKGKPHDIDSVKESTEKVFAWVYEKAKAAMAARNGTPDIDLD